MATAEKIIAPHPPQDGRDWDNQCARCGSSLTWVECEGCAGEGHTWEEIEPGWEEECLETCDECGGAGGDWVCLSGREWCESHPLPGRENVKRGEVEWFTFDPPGVEKAR